MSSPSQLSLSCTHTILTELWFYQKHPKRTGATLGVIGGILVAPAALAYAGITSVGVATGNLTFAFTKQVQC